MNTATRQWLIVATISLISLVGGLLTTGMLEAYWRTAPSQPAGGGGGEPIRSTKPIPEQLFRDWPADKIPAVALVLTGQQHSYLKFCGCSTPQLGGYERRYNFIAKLKEKGWPVVSADLGDLILYKSGLHDQSLLKYETAMQALELLNYAAIGVGEADFQLPLLEGLTRFTLQKPDANPRILGANLADRLTRFPLDDKRSMIGDVTLVRAGNQPNGLLVGIVGITGRSVIKTVTEQDPTLKFEPNDKVLNAALQKMNAAKAELKMLLFQGAFADAKDVAQKFYPNVFDVILCLSSEDTPPSQADMVGRTMIVRVGHRGRFLGVVGAYRGTTAEKPFDLFYQSVPVGEEFETDDDKEANHPMLAVLQKYAQEVKNQKFLERTPQKAYPVHPALGNAKPTFVGSESCKDCHAADYVKHNKTRHSHALDALIDGAKKPTLRQFDPECIVCHVVGYGYQSGYINDAKTPHLKHVGCESCHGPGSLHVQSPKDPKYALALSPWKSKPEELLPDHDTMVKGYDAMTVEQRGIVNRVNDMCRKCHDDDNDPHFKFEKFWPRVNHGKNAPK